MYRSISESSIHDCPIVSKVYVLDPGALLVMILVHNTTARIDWRVVLRLSVYLWVCGGAVGALPLVYAAQIIFGGHEHTTAMRFSEWIKVC